MIQLEISEQEKLWAESYIRHLNATQACRDAGYEGSDVALRQRGRTLLTKPHIQAYIQSVVERNREKEEHRIASMEEVMQFYSDVMNGKVKDQFGLEAQLSDRIKAAQSLDKVLSIAKKAEVDNSKEDITIEQHYGRSDVDE